MFSFLTPTVLKKKEKETEDITLLVVIYEKKKKTLKIYAEAFNNRMSADNLHTITFNNNWKSSVERGDYR